MSPSDQELLQRFAVDGDNEAFAALVQRYITVVYHSALRRTNDAHAAEDISQRVFTALARKAKQLETHVAIVGWLHLTTRFEAEHYMRTERRRLAREQAAAQWDEMNAEHQRRDWQKVRPIIDAALDKLGATDRDAVLLRFFANRSFGEIGEQLGLSENAARMRVDRALGKLNGLLKAREITSVSLATLLAAEAAAASTPPTLALHVTTQALAGASVAATTGATFLAMSTSKTIIAAAIVLVGVGVGTTWSIGQAREARTARAAVEAQEAGRKAELADLQRRTSTATKRLQDAEARNAELLALAKSVRGSRVNGAAADEPITEEIVEARFKRGQALVENGDPAAAFNDLFWCYTVGMPKLRSWGPVRSTSLGYFGKLAERYPPAAEFLRTLRDRALPRVRDSATDNEAATEFASANHELKDDAANLALIDELLPGDPRRRTLAGASEQYLVERQRYKEAAEGRPYASVSSTFEMMIERSRSTDAPAISEKAKQEGRTFLLNNTASNIEILVGIGDIEHARTLAERLLKFDGSAATKALIQQHAARAGRPDLLNPPVAR